MRGCGWHRCWRRQKKQNPGKPLAEIELDKIKVKLDKSEYALQILLFGPGTKITKSGPEGWLISYAEGTQQADGYILEGSLKVNTGNAEQLAGTSYPDNMWSVEMQPDFVIKAISSNNEQTTIQMKDGKTSLFRDPSGTAAYVVTLENIRANFETTSSGKEYVSAWNGRLTLTPEEDESVAFSDIWDDDLKADGAAQGLSIYANSTETAPMGLSYKVQGGVYNFFSRVASNSVGGLYPDRGGIADLRVHAGRRLRSDAVPLPEGGVQMDVRRRKAELYGVLQRILLYDLTDYCREIATRRLLVWRPPFSCYGMCRVSGRPPSSRMTEGDAEGRDAQQADDRAREEKGRRQSDLTGQESRAEQADGRR